MTCLLFLRVAFALADGVREAAGAGLPAVFAIPAVLLLILVYVPCAAALLGAAAALAFFLKKRRGGAILAAATVLQIAVGGIVYPPVNFFDGAVPWIEIVIGVQFALGIVRLLVLLLYKLRGDKGA